MLKTNAEKMLEAERKLAKVEQQLKTETDPKARKAMKSKMWRLMNAISRYS